MFYNSTKLYLFLSSFYSCMCMGRSIYSPYKLLAWASNDEKSWVQVRMQVRMQESTTGYVIVTKLSV